MERIANPVTGRVDDDDARPVPPPTRLMVLCRYGFALLIPVFVLIDVAAAGVGFFDLLVTRGEYQVKPPLPCAPATECVGVRRDSGQRVA